MWRGHAHFRRWGHRPLELVVPMVIMGRWLAEILATWPADMTPGEEATPPASPPPSPKPAVGSTTPTKVCRQCRHRLEPDFAFCPQCGSRLQPSVCRYCGQPLEQATDRCPHCGGHAETGNANAWNH